METNLQPDLNTRAGTVGGTLLVVLLHIRTEEIFKTALLAAIGAAVSFTVSMTLKFLIRYLMHKKPPP
jgi:hypothetical protein